MSTNEMASAAPDTLRGDMLRGVREIASFLDLSERQAYNLVANGQLPGCFQLGRIWCARRTTLIEHLRRLERGAGD
ncbi:MAG: DNA-binding protein [Methylocystis sp.]|jgi:hypothetical protein